MNKRKGHHPWKIVFKLDVTSEHRYLPLFTGGTQRQPTSNSQIINTYIIIVRGMWRFGERLRDMVYILFNVSYLTER